MSGRVPLADRPVRLPTLALVAAVVVASGGAGALWFIGAILAGAEPGIRLAGPAAAGVVAAASLLGIVVLKPWRTRTIATWPILWTAVSFIRGVAALAGTYLLYSSPPFGSVHVWLAMIAAYAAVMIAETRVYVLSMRIPRQQDAGEGPTV